MNNLQKIANSLIVLLVLLATDAAAQKADWLDRQPIRNWNSTSNRLPLPDRRHRPQVQHCKQTARPTAFAQDRLLLNSGMFPVGPAQVFGSTTVITAAKDFDGMCRPLDFQTFVFQGSKLVGTLSPELMDSRTDGALGHVRLFSATDMEAEYSRYTTSDALCCPSRTQKVRFDISGAGAAALLKPEGSDTGGTDVGGALAGTKWRWERLQTPLNNVTVTTPENYTVEFMTDGAVQVRSDCNNGRGRYTANGSSLTFSAIAMTRRGCLRGSQDNLFNRSLSAARIYRRDRDKLYIDLLADGGTMHLARMN